MIFDENVMDELWACLRRVTKELTECKTDEERCIVQGKATVLHELLEANERLIRETISTEEKPDAGRTGNRRPIRPPRR